MHTICMRHTFIDKSMHACICFARQRGGGGVACIYFKGIGHPWWLPLLLTVQLQHPLWKLIHDDKYNERRFCWLWTRGSYRISFLTCLLQNLREVVNVLCTPRALIELTIRRRHHSLSYMLSCIYVISFDWLVSLQVDGLIATSFAYCQMANGIIIIIIIGQTSVGSQ